MDPWVIKKISRPPTSHPLAHDWPGSATYTVENTVTHEVRNITCAGEGCVEQMIEDGRFDEEVGDSGEAAQPASS